MPQSRLADFIERNVDTIVDEAMAFARKVPVGTALDDAELRDHLPQIVAVIVDDLRTPQSRVEEIEKSEGRGPRQGPRSPAAIHALHRAHSGFSISGLVAEYRAMRASVLRAWADSPDSERSDPTEITRFNEAIDEAITESVEHYATEVDRWRNIFLGVLGHDLRNPLNAIMLTSEMIARASGDDPTLSRAAQRLLRSGANLHDLLDRLLAYNRARIGSGFSVECCQVDLADACRDEVDQLRTALPHARIELECPGTLPGRFDARAVGEVLSNLVSNAGKYGQDGAPITVTLRDLGDGAELLVSNRGPTIPAETLGLMFEPLRRGAVLQGENERASLGLGLFIVDQTVKAHGGTIDARSEDGTTTFRVRFPHG